MRYCTKCGCELEDNAITCEKCGNAVINRNSVVVNQTLKISAIGIVAFVLSIIGFMTAFLRIGMLFDIVAIILAIFVLKKSKKCYKKGLPIVNRPPKVRPKTNDWEVGFL